MGEAHNQHVTIGQQVDDFSLKDADGNATTLSELDGERGIVLGFLHGTYCPHCMQQLNRSNRLADRLAEEQVTLGWILHDKASSIATYKLAAHPAPRFAVLPDSDPSAAAHFNVPAEVRTLAPAPYVFYIDGERTVRHVIDKSDNPHAPLDVDALLAAIRERETPQKSKTANTPKDI